jgi:hypothetical protein
MKVHRMLMALPIAAVLSACAQPVPPDKSNYVGEWASPNMALRITQDGNVRYARTKDGVNKTMNGPMKGFEGDSFVVGIGPMTSTFTVTAAPHKEGGTWRMTVDGVEMTRK